MMTVKDIVVATGGRLCQGDLALQISGVSIDSRAVKAGELFVAIKGDRFDGHNFIRQTLRKGVSAIVISKGGERIPREIAVIKVVDTTKALGLLARYHRDRFSIPVIAITGSAGKTTTKEMIAGVLETRFRTLKNIATQNNHIGVPMTLLKMNRSHEMVVVELGTNHFGEIAWLTRICNPTVAVLTNIGESHLEFLGSLAGVFKEKINIVTNMNHRGSVVFNNDDPFLRRIPQKIRGQRLNSYGIENRSRYRAHAIVSRGAAIRFRVNSTAGFELKSPAKHNVYNALAAVCCGKLFHVGEKQTKNALRRFQFPKGRQQIQSIAGLRVIDDSYNANPLSLRSAIATLHGLKTSGRKVLVCADMLELGRRSKMLHAQIGVLVARSSVDLLFTVGRHAGEIYRKARKRKTLQAFHFSSLPNCYRSIKKSVRPGDTMLVKGSRAMKMERLIELLKEK